MTDTTVARDHDRGNTEWRDAEARYRTASERLSQAQRHAAGLSGDVDEVAVTDHVEAARALIETPATHITHVAVKIRAADNMLALSASYPELPSILVRDICEIVGLHDPDQSALPNRI